MSTEEITTSTPAATSSHAAKMVSRAIEGGHDASIFSGATLYPLSAQVAKIDFDKGLLTLYVLYEGKNVKEYVSGKAITLDIRGRNRNKEVEFISFEGIDARSVANDENFHKVQCTLPQSIFKTDKRNGFRVPLIQGMHASAVLEVYAGTLSIKTRLRNFSTGGCMLEVPLQECTALKIGQAIPSVAIEFPNGDSFISKGSIRYIRPFGNSSHAAIGIKFIDVDTDMKRRLLYFVNEAEMEVAYRTGLIHRSPNSSSLFTVSNKVQNLDTISSSEKSKLPPMVLGLREVVRQLQITLISLKNESPISEDALYDSADTLLHLLESNRFQFLYALCCLNKDPQWIRHSIRVAGLLGDFLSSNPAYASDAREAVVGALLHSMGKPLLLNEKLPSLDATLAGPQKAMLKGHVEALEIQLDKSGWISQPGSACHDVIFNSNERLDGSGYPKAKRAEDLSDIARIAAIIKILDTLTSPRNKRSGLTPLEAYRWVYKHPELFDRKWLAYYVKRYSLYPVGSLVKFSRGFLAWVLELDKDGRPSKIKVVKNPAFKDVTLNVVLTTVDYAQLGSLECVVRPEHFNLTPQ